MCLPYIGGKSRISEQLIIPNIPKDIEIYLECFSGMFWTFFKMNLSEYTNLKKIVYNDFNPLNVNFFRCLKENSNLLLEYCQKLPVQKKGEDITPSECKEVFYVSQKKLYDENLIIDKADYDLASRYALVLTSVFSGANPKSSKYIDLKGKYHSKFTSFKNKLSDKRWVDKFKSITVVENMDFEKVITKYDGEKTYIYADPPYHIVGEGKYYSNHDFTRDDHLRLSNCLKSIKGKFALSYYDFPELSEYFPKDKYLWKSKEFAKAAMAKAGKEQSKATEILIMNYNI